ncbi:MAG: autotransporter-associated beta strand repeat-containing protein [Kiritimatiellae bacterium]|nr:autotransporter-associated beta strand repeat-containing protein [Kiritimatiellia bacterium]
MIYYWQLNEGSGTSVADLAGSATGTISGATWITEVAPPFVIPGLPVSAWNLTTGGNWSKPANWLDSLIASGNGCTAFFTNQPPAAISVTNDMTGLLLGQFQINSTSAHTFSGNAITLTNATLPALISAITGSHTFDLPLITTTLGVSLLTQSGATLSMANVISGPGAVAVNTAAGNGGTVTLTAANTYTGATKLGSGTFITDTLANGGAPAPIGASSSDAANLELGPGTLRYTGAAATTDRGYTVNAGKLAAVLDTNSDITFSGQINATSGAMVKAGAGTLTYTYPGLNKYVAGEGNPNAMINIAENNGSPAAGFSGLTILDGKIVFGATGQTNHFLNRIDIGMCTTTNAGAETSAELEVNSGTFICTTTLSIGRNNGNTNTAPPGTTSKLTINGGESYLSLVAAGHNAVNHIGFNPRSIFEINGGYVNVSRTCNMGEHSGSRISMNVNGGHLYVQDPGAGIRLGAGSGEGTLTMTGSAVVETAGYIMMAQGAGDNSRGTCNLNGGTLIARNIRKGSGTSATLNFNGGVFKPHTAGESLAGLTAANVSANGALIDTALAPYTLSQNLLHDANLGGTIDGGLTKLGAGTLTVACAAPTYTGPTLVSEGTLLVTGALPTATDLTVAAGANLTAGGNGDKTLALGSLTLLGNSMVTLGFLTDGSANDKLSIASSPDLENNRIALIRTDSDMPFTLNGVYTIMTYTGADPVVSELEVANPVFGKTYTFAATGGLVTITIAIDSAGASVWNVDASGAWATHDNWTTAPAPGSAVRFDDAITAPRTITTAGQTVGNIYFNSELSYTLGGSGLTLAPGAGIFVESGSHVQGNGVLTLPGDTPIVFAPGTSLRLGHLSGAAAALTAQGEGTLTLDAIPDALQSLTLAISTLVLDFNYALDVPITLLRSLVLNPSENKTVTLNSTVSGSGGLTKGGSSTLEATAGNSYSGATTVSAGTLRVATLADGGQASPIGAASAAAGNLILGKATLHVTGAATTDRGYTLRTDDSARAGVLRVEDEVTFGGQILADSGPFLKTGPGTVYYTYPGANKLNAHEVGGAGRLQNIGLNGDGPTQGITGFTVTDGRVVLGVPGQTNTVVGHLDIGLYTSTAPDGETAGELVLNDGVLTTGGQTVSIGRHNGTTITAPGGVSSRLTINGGAFNCGTLATGNNAAGITGFNARPVIEVTGGELNVGGGYLSVGESTGSYAALLVSGGKVSIYNNNRNLRMGGWEVDKSGGDGEVVLSNNGVIEVNGNVEMAFGPNSRSTVRLNGGTLIARNIVMGVGVRSELYFNGGVLRPSTAGQSMAGLTSASISTNGAVIDTSLASYTVAQNLTTDPALGALSDGGLLKLGANTLTLTANANSFNGKVKAQAGLLRMVVRTTNNLFVAKGAAFDALGERSIVGDLSGEGLLTNGVIAVTGTLDAGPADAPAGAQMTIENLNLAAGATFSCPWSTNALGKVTNDFVIVTGALTSEGAGFIDLNRTEADPIPVPFEATIMSYGSFSGSFTGWKVTNTGLPPGTTVSTAVSIVNGEVTVKVMYGGSLIIIR